MSVCLGKRFFSISGTPGIKKHLCLLRAVCHSARSWHAQPQGGRGAGSGLNPSDHLARHPEEGKRAKSALVTQNTSVGPVKQLWRVMSRGSIIQTLDCHWLFGPIAQNRTLDWVWLQPKYYLQFGFLLSFFLWFLYLTYGEISELLRL